MSSWELFDRLHQAYERWYAENPVTAQNELRAVLSVDPGQAWRPCVDVGSGTGYFTAPLGCLGVEPSVYMAFLGRSLRGVDAVQGRAEALPLAGGRAGSAFMIVTLCFLPDPAQAVLEVRRALRPGGHAVACIVPRGSQWAEEYERRAAEGDPFYSVARFYYTEEVRSLFTSYGFAFEGAVGTLTYGPYDEPRPEVPRPYTGEEGFVCLRFKSPGRPQGADEEARKA